IHDGRASASPFARVFAECMGCGQSLWQASTAQHDPPALADGFARLDYLLGRFQAEAASIGAGLLVVVIPTKLEVEGSTVRDDVQHAMQILDLHYDAVAFDDEIRSRMMALPAALGLPAVDLLPRLRTAFAGHGRPQFWSVDWHLNVDGHEAVARHLAPVVSALLRSRG